MNNTIKQLIGSTFMDIADAIETGQIQEKIKIGLTTLGSEHGTENLIKGAELALKHNPNIQIVLIGPKADTKLEIIEANSEQEMHTTMENLLDEKTIQACVTMHYNFPMG
ncbi:MAG: glycine reductase, partial [Clostridia bacterium]|nr:glycine reductase [Clostridia bacterium]